MPLTPVRGSTFDPVRRYRQVVWAGGYTDMDYARNEEQAILDLEREKGIQSVWRWASVINPTLELIPTIAGNTVSFTQGRVYIGGRMEWVADASLTYAPLNDSSVAYLQWNNTQIDQSADPQLANPSTNDPVQDRYQIISSLVTTSPDALDEPFDNFRYASNPGRGLFLNTTVPALIYNHISGVSWTLTSGAPSSIAIGVPKAGCLGRGLRLNHLAGVTTQLQISVQLQASTQYYVYVSLKTVYGQPDLTSSSSGFFVGLSRTATATPLTSYFGTTGGASLSGDYVLNTFTFTSDGSSSPVNFSLGIAAAAPTTQVYVAQVLVTTQPLTSVDRHYYALFGGSTMQLLNTPPFIVPASNISAATHPPVVTATDIQTSINQLADAITSLQGQVAVFQQVIGVANLRGNRLDVVAPGYNQYYLSADTVLLRNPTTTTLPPVIIVDGFDAMVDMAVAGPALGGRDRTTAFPAFNGVGGGLINIYAIGGANVTAGLIASLASPGPPAMPAGYTHWAYLTTVVNSNGSAGPVQLLDTVTTNNFVSIASYLTYAVVLTGGSSTTPAVVSARQIVPSNALSYQLSVEVYRQWGANGTGTLSCYLDPTAASSGANVDGDFLQIQLGTSNWGSWDAWHKIHATVPNRNQQFYYSFKFSPAAPVSYHVDFRVNGFSVNNGAF